MTLISHAATAATQSAGFPADEPLLSSQSAVAARVRGMLAHAHACICAPEARARQTAGMLGREFATDSALRDLDYGRWAGKGLAEIGEREPENMMAWLSEPAAAPHGGESIVATIERVGAWLAGRKEAGGHTVAVTHPAVIRAAILVVLEAPPQSFWKIDVRPFGMAEISSDGRRWALRSLGNAGD